MMYKNRSPKICSSMSKRERRRFGVLYDAADVYKGFSISCQISLNVHFRRYVVWSVNSLARLFISLDQIYSGKHLKVLSRELNLCVAIRATERDDDSVGDE